MADERLRIKIEADAARAEQDLKTLARIGDELESDDVTVFVDAKTEAAQGELKRLKKLLQDADDPVDIKVILTGIRQAEQQIKNLEQSGKRAGRSFDDLVDAADSLPGPLGEAAGLMGSGPGGLAGGALAAGAAITAAVSAFADGATEAKALQTAVGGTVEESSRLLNVTGQVGLEYNDILEIIAESNRAIGLNADEAERLGVNLAGTPIERFQQLFEAVYKIPDPLQRAATASKFFGEEGSKQLPRLAGMFDDLGAAMAGVDQENVFTEEDAARAAEFSKNMSKLKSAFTGMANELARNVLPKLELFFELTDKFGGAKQLIVGVDKTSAAWQELIENMGGIVQAGKDVAVAADAVGALTEEQRAAAIEAGFLSDEVKGANDALSGLGASLGTTVRLAKLAAEAYNAQTTATEFMATAAEAAAEGINAGAEAQQDFTDGFFAFGNRLQEQTAAWAAYKESLVDVGHNLDTTTEKGAEQQDALQALADTVDNELVQAYVDAAGDSAKFEQSASQLADTMRNKLQKETKLSDAAIEEVLRHLGLMPDQVETRYKLSGTEDALTRLDLLQSSIDELPEDVQTTVTQKILVGDYQGALATVQNYYNRNPARITATVELAAGALSRLTSSITNTINSALGGGRTTQSTAARYVWRNGRYVEI